VRLTGLTQSDSSDPYGSLTVYLLIDDCPAACQPRANSTPLPYG